MTPASTGHGARSGVVRPFAPRVLRQEWAAEVVTPMADALGHGAERRRLGVTPTAYEDSPPALFVYRMRGGSGDHVGVVADVRLDAFAAGEVRGHESVEPERVDALLRHYAEVPVRSELVALLHHPRPGATDVVAEVCRTRPLLQFPGPDGFEHTVWRVAGEQETATLAEALGPGVHYIADGHHRVTAALREWDTRGRPDGSSVLCVLFPMDGLRLSAFHRRIAGPLEAGFLLESAAADFEVREVSEAEQSEGIALYAAGRWYDLTHARPRPQGAAGLDTAILQTRLLDRLLGSGVPGRPRIEVVPAHLPLEVVTMRCEQDGGALFVLRPPSLGALTEVADRGEVMPPKTTYFAPKPYAGIFLT